MAGTNIIGECKARIRALEDEIQEYRADYIILVDEQKNIAAISALLSDIRTNLAVNFPAAVKNFEELIIPNLSGIKKAKEALSFDELFESGSSYNKLKTYCDELKAEYDGIGKAIDGISKSMLIYQDSISVGTVYHFQSAVLVRINLIRLKSFC